MEPEVTIHTIHSALSTVEKVGIDTVRRRAHREKWSHREVMGKGRGGKTKWYLSATLPGDVQTALRVVAVPAAREDTLPTLNALKELTVGRAKEDKAFAKVELAKAYVDRLSQAGYGQKEKVRRLFIQTYNLGKAGSFPAVFKHVGSVDVRGKTIEGWLRKLRKHHWNPDCLVDRRGLKSRGRRSVTQEQMQIILGIVQSLDNKPDKPIQEIIHDAIEVMEARGIKPLSDSTYRRWLVKDWIPNNYDQWILWREGEKGLNDKVLYNLIRDREKLDPGDLLVADGHVFNFEVISPTTKRPKRMMLVMFTDFKTNYPLGWEISDTENTEAISVALRRAILRLGKIPKAVYIDNGRAFKGTYFIKEGDEEQALHLKGVYGRLGIKWVIIAWAYHGQSKPIERIFKIMGEMERSAITYVGSSIDNKPAWLNRGEKFMRRLHEKVNQGTCHSLEEAHRAVAIWCDKYVNRPMGPNSQFPGLTPNELMVPGLGPGVDPVALRCLMMVTERRLIRQNGVRLNGEWYYDPALYGKKFYVYCRYDFLYKDSVLVYHEDTHEFICEAFRQGKVHPMASQMGTEADKAEFKRQLEMKQAGKKYTMDTAEQIVENQILPEARKQLESAGLSLEPGHADKTKALPAPAKSKPKSLSKADKEKIKAQLESIECEYEDDSCITHEPEVLDTGVQIFEQLREMNESDRFEKLIEMEIRDMLIPKEFKAFMKYFEQSSEYRRYKDHFDAHRQKIALLYDVERTGTEN